MAPIQDRFRRDFLRRLLEVGGALSLWGCGHTSPADSLRGGGGQYDYIVVGTGSAGSVLIRRIVDAGFSVLALEAGPTDALPAIHDPSLVTQLYGSTVDWSFETTQQVFSADQRIGWSRGKTFGGSSSINGMMYVRGLPADFDHWASEGATGWAWRDVEPYFRRMENFRLDDPSGVHGHDGPLQIGRPAMTALAQDFVSAAAASGMPAPADYNDGTDNTGASLSQLTILPDGQRASAWTCYVAPLLPCPKLTVLTNARVLDLEMQGARVLGVRFTCRGETFVAYAGRETLLCAGSIMTPAVLLHSGIGARPHLETHGIRTVVDLPGVGENLHDQLTCWTVWQTARKNTPSVTTGMEATVFFKSAPSQEGPDGQVLLSTNTFPIDGYPSVTQGFTLVPTVLAPKSRGSVRLASADPLAYPLMNPNACADPYDVEVVARYALQVREVMRQPEFESWHAVEVAPGPSVTTQAEMESFVKKTGTTAAHQVGTARMGNDALSVVDPELRVHGVSGLRVVDASVMPVVTSGNTNAPTIMIAERAADLILKGA
ncbi:GMC family oxidoreductase N-terminal domain-containing protein [Caballeronia sp. LZ034LL]|uniref:GMC family oxidoreductase n=1 Tax=Caballeronia sp. LZ034LL TaxID=3038567 RepID=UPI0028636F1A|nr:GMC family oxidoreductase N-terminal domain-containing protein [Caballeronia sp. LZ034LL]MDR5832995.1 GMC family oxidoreductase N-terminal domain-containing protein [Caballeronia sp. LZ034LL]